MITFIRILTLPFYLLQSLLVIVSSRKLLATCLVPYLIGIFSFIMFVSIAYMARDKVLDYLFSTTNVWLHTSLSWIVFFLLIAVSGVLAVATMFLVGAVYIERFIILIMERENLSRNSDESRPVLQVLVSAVRVDCLRLLYLIVFGLLAFIAGMIPFLVFLPVLYAWIVLGFDFVEQPMALQGMEFRARFSQAKNHFVEVVALGAFLSLLFLIPLGAIFFVQPALYTSVKLISKWPHSRE